MKLRGFFVRGDVKPVPVSVVAGIARLRKVLERELDQVRFAAVYTGQPFILR
ncbi:hypothetical protein D1872_231770 [compost metagenome]